MRGNSWLRKVEERLRDDRGLQSAAAIALLLTVLGLALLLLNDLGILSLAFIRDNWTFLINPAITALSVTVLSFCAGFALGIPMGLLKAFGPNLIRQGGKRSLLLAPIYSVVTGYIEFVRGTPAFVQILLIVAWITRSYPGVPRIEFWGGILALTLNTTGYQAEVFRAGFQSVGQGQIEAAKSIGMRPFQTFAHITLPQSLRLIVLPLTNEWIGLFKASALLWYVAIQELMWAGSYLSYRLVHPVEAFLMVALVYLLIIIPIGKAVAHLERKHRIPGLGVPEPVSRGRFRLRRTAAV